MSKADSREAVRSGSSMFLFFLEVSVRDSHLSSSNPDQALFCVATIYRDFCTVCLFFRHFDVYEESHSILNFQNGNMLGLRSSTMKRDNYWGAYALEDCWLFFVMVWIVCLDRGRARCN